MNSKTIEMGKPSKNLVRLSLQQLFFFSMVFGLSIPSFADENSRKAPQDFHEYYTIVEGYQIVRAAWTSFADLSKEVFNIQSQEHDSGQDFESQNAQRNKLPLLRWKKIAEQPSDPAEPYNRKKHFGGWKRIPKTCMNVRAHILIRDSTTEVGLRPSGCTVDSGTWNDPYTGQVFTSAEDLDIDHFVPLKNAYISGGWKWDREKICRYGNFMKNKYHLIPSYKSENRRKSDLTPADYLPPNPKFLCEYAIRWLKIKTIWGLVMMPPEAAAIQKVIRENNCDPKSFEMTGEELEQNKEASEHDPICESLSTQE